MAHCPSCGKKTTNPSRILKNHSLTVEAYECKKCRHNFKVTINQADYMEFAVDLPSKIVLTDASKNRK